MPMLPSAFKERSPQFYHIFIMCLSDCSKCKYFDRNPHHRGDITCSLNPAYASAWKRLDSLDEITKSCLPIDDCREFEPDLAFEEKTIALSLNFFDWQRLEQETFNPAIGKALKNTMIELSLALTVERWQEIANSTSIGDVHTTLKAQGIEANRDPWICVDSSCINAIAYLESSSTLQIKFNRGDIYEYDNVPQRIFLSLLDADSHGEFFNQHIKDIYPYRLL